MQDLTEPFVAVEADVGQRLTEAGDRPAVRILVRPVAAVDLQVRGLAARIDAVHGPEIAVMEAWPARQICMPIMTTAAATPGTPA